MITKLKPNQIFVFGSNLRGFHSAGAAKQAKNKFGAVEGVGEGPTGQSYALPTLNIRFERFSPTDMRRIVARFFNYARRKPENEFLLTKVGCGIAGYEETYMKSLFLKAPKNVILPEDWRA